MSPKKRRCGLCGTGWSVDRLVLKDGSVVENYWCVQCDGRPSENPNPPTAAESIPA